VAARLDLVRILLVEVAQLDDLGLPVERVVVEIHLGVERDQIAPFGDHQRIDLDQAGVELGERAADAAHERYRLAHLAALEPEGERDPAAVERLEADHRVEADPDDLLGRLGRNLLDVDPALGRGHQGEARGRPVDQRREVELARDVAAVLDVDAAHLPALGPGLMGDEGHAEHLLGQLAHLLDRLGELDAAALAAAAGVDLRLDHPGRAAERTRRRLGLLGRVRHLAREHADAEVLEQRLGLVFVNVHQWLARLPDAAPGRAGATGPANGPTREPPRTTRAPPAPISRTRRAPRRSA